MSLGPLEILLIIIVIALVFGARKLPELGKGVGQGIKEFKKEVRDEPNQARGELDATTPAAVVKEPAVQEPQKRP